MSINSARRVSRSAVNRIFLYAGVMLSTSSTEEFMITSLLQTKLILWKKAEQIVVATETKRELTSVNVTRSTVLLEALIFRVCRLQSQCAY